MFHLLIFLSLTPSLIVGHHEECEAAKVCEKLAHVDEMLHLNQMKMQDMQRTINLQERRIENLEKQLETQETIIMNLQAIAEEEAGLIPEQPEREGDFDKERVIADENSPVVTNLAAKVDDVQQRTRRVEDKLKNEERSRMNLEVLVNETRFSVQRIQFPEQRVQYLITSALQNLSRINLPAGNDLYEKTYQLEARLSAVEAVTRAKRFPQLGNQEQVPQCGRVKPNDPTQWPWMVGIIRPKKYYYNCSGTLVDKKHFITSQNCFSAKTEDSEEFNVSQWPVIIPGSREPYKISGFEVYKEDYGSDGTGIILVTLAREVTIPGFEPACLPGQQHADLEDKWATVARVVGGVGESQVLIGGRVPVLTNQDCLATTETLPMKLRPRILCINHGWSEFGCWTSIGSPLMIEENSRWFVVGVVSFNLGCNQIYPIAKVSKYTDWIKKEISKN